MSPGIFLKWTKSWFSDFKTKIAMKFWSIFYRFLMRAIVKLERSRIYCMNLFKHCKKASLTVFTTAGLAYLLCKFSLMKIKVHLSLESIKEQISIKNRYLISKLSTRLRVQLAMLFCHQPTNPIKCCKINFKTQFLKRASS